MLVFIILACLQIISAKNYSVVLVGGHLADENEEIWGRIVELGGGVGKARFGVVTAASEDPCCDQDSSWVYYRDLLTKYGAAEVYYLPITSDHPEKNSDPTVVAHIQTLTGFFLGGGDQTRLVKAYYTDYPGAGGNNSTDGGRSVASPALLAIRSALYASGGVVAGTSAGTDIQTASVMITGGSSYDALVGGADVYWRPGTRPNPNILTGYAPGGFSFFPHGLVDTHFENRGRAGRIVRLMADTVQYPCGSQYSFGIDENTALVVTGSWGGGRRGEVLGQAGVTLFDLTLAEVAEAEGGWWARGVRVSHMTRGDVLDLQSYVVTPAPFKTPLLGHESNAHADISEDIFKQDAFEFNRIATSLFDCTDDVSTVGYTAQVSPKYAVEMHRDREQQGEGARAEGFGGVDPATGEFVVTYSNMQVHFHPVE